MLLTVKLCSLTIECILLCLLLILILLLPWQLRTEYSYYLRNHQFIDMLLTSLFHLMPENPVVEPPLVTQCLSTSQSYSASLNMFSDASAFNILG